MKKLFLLLLGIGLGLNLQAQSIDVQGQILDSLDSPLASATVVLLNAEDSLMHSFTISNPQGNFSFKKVPSGDYILQISYLGYANSSQFIQVPVQNTSLQLGKVYLQSQTETLEAVSILEDRIPIVIKEDTIEYNADAFKVQPNSNVEQLLKRLPGIEVEKDGTVKAQGEEVRKVLVDGKQFFGDDPKIATKNLPADAVKKVQVFDKLSDVAEFTGVDDGERNKTINLKLKEDKKNGYFGKLSAGYGSDQRYEARANVNRFAKKMQLSLLGSLNNINQQNFSFQDYLSFSGGIGNLISKGGLDGVNIGEILNGGAGQGINTLGSIGLNFNYDFNDKTELRLSYFYNQNRNDLLSLTTRQNFNEEDFFLSEEQNNQNSQSYNHRLNSRLKYNIKKGQDLTLQTTIRFNDQNRDRFQSNQTFEGEDLLSNESEVDNTLETQNINLSTSLLYRVRLGKARRSITAKGNLGWADQNNDERLISQNRFFSDNLLVSQEDLNQIQEEDNVRWNYGIDFTYTEPISKKGVLQFNYLRSNQDNDLRKDFLDVPDDDSMPVFNETLSTNYRSDYTYDRGGIKFVQSTKRSYLRFGFDLQNSNLDGFIRTQDLQIERNFFNFLPAASWKYQFGSAKTLYLEYRTSVREPQLNQLQPVVNNTNPLRVYIGNPNLGTEYQHQLRISYNLFDQFSSTGLFFNLTARYTRDKITNSSSIDEDFVQTIQPINVDRDFLLTSFISFSRPIKPLGIKFRFKTNFTFNQGLLFVNAVENEVNRYFGTIDLRLENRRKTWLDLGVGAKYGFNWTAYSINQEQNQQFFTPELYSDLSIDFLKKINLSTAFSYTFYRGQAFEGNQEVPLWQASLSLNFLKFDRGQLKLSVFDILNQNQGIQRNSQFNFIQEQQSNVLGRYVMATFTFSLNKFGGDSKGKIIIEK